ncbi:MAG: hypothetical protein GJ680_18455 [Alteromonadaceae bacterium]|nr:hypothetical protein [Alteromonadaceae bacterium]
MQLIIGVFISILGVGLSLHFIDDSYLQMLAIGFWGIVLAVCTLRFITDEQF